MESTKGKVIYVRSSGRFDHNNQPIGMQLCIGNQVWELTDSQAKAIARDIIKRIL